jgi:hypothetical protein
LNANLAFSISDVKQYLIMSQADMHKEMIVTNGLLREILAVQRGIDEKLRKIAINTSTR